MQRSSGVLLPISALPSPYGIGTLGKSAYEFVDFLSQAGQKYWQILPLGPTSYGDSPYSSFSTFAGNPYFIDLDLLIRDNLLTREEVEAESWGEDPAQVDYGLLYRTRFRLLRRAFDRCGDALWEELDAFRWENREWLEKYALFMAVKDHFGSVSWTQWPDENIRLGRPEALAAYAEGLKSQVDFYVFLQYLFFRQWDALRAYAHEQGISFIGDLPIYVAMDSADVWESPQFFQLDENRMPTEVAGVPPDAFTADGQLWGNPLYNWEALANDGYGWWVRRVEGAKKLYDMIRIDHFRGFESYWAVPYGHTTAKLGRWRPGPGMDLVSVFSARFPDLNFIAEDLGYITPQVRALLDGSGFPGMKILQFGFDVDGDSDYMPHHCGEKSVCYIGTHDNPTVLGWVDSLTPKERAFAQAYMHITPEEGWCWGMIRAGMGAGSELFVSQMQDLLELPAAARTNIPGTLGGNWVWRMLPGQDSPALAKKLREYTATFRRLSKAPEM